MLSGRRNEKACKIVPSSLLGEEREEGTCVQLIESSLCTIGAVAALG